MICGKCGYDNTNGARFCKECGALLDRSDEDAAEKVPNSPIYDNNSDKNNNNSGESAEFPDHDFLKDKDVASDYGGREERGYDDYDCAAADGDPKSASSSAALENLKKFEEGSITHPNDKPKKKGKIYCPQNPMLWSFLWLLLFGAVLCALSVYFFNVDLEGTQIVFGTAFSVFTAAVLVIDFIYYFPAALALDRMLKGKGVRLEYRLKKYELVDLAEEAKKRNRGFYLAIGLFGIAFSVYYIYILATAVVKTNLMWISLFFSVGVSVVFALLFFIMPKFNYERMMQNGARVIIGNKSVYYGGTYYHWRKIQTEATYGTLNTKKHRLEIVFAQEQKDGSIRRRKVEMYAPDSAVRGIAKLLNEYEESVGKYREKLSEKAAIGAGEAEGSKDGSKDKKKKGK